MRNRNLFLVTYWILRIATILSGVIAGLMVLALGGLLAAAIMPDHLGVHASLEGFSRAVILETGAFAVTAVLINAVLFLFTFHLTEKIVATAMSGDPFVNENATRLMRIGWLLLGMEAVGLVTMAGLNQLPEKLRDNIHVGVDTSPIGFVGILLVFVLAYVFRRGSEMRAELESTV